jgi:PAS domain S-box-containing protein
MNIPTFTLLIVEDLPASREVYRQCLVGDRSCDYDLLEAASVAEGLELCRTRSIDAILLDYQLPDGDGLGFLAALSAQGHANRPPVVMMTGYGSESIAVRAMKLGAADYVVKTNLTPELLCSTMQSAIENDLRLQLWQRDDRFSGSPDAGFVAAGREIATQNQVELAATRAAQERDRFFNLSIDMLAIANFDGYFTYLNPAWEKVLGFSNSELMAESSIEFVHPQDRELTLAMAQQISAGEIVIDFENRYRCQDDTYRWLLWSVMPDIEQSMCYAIAHDITERKQAEIALKQRNQELDSFVYIVAHDLKAPLRSIANLSQWIEDDFQGVLAADLQQQMTLLRSRVSGLGKTIDGLLEYARVGTIDTKIELVSVAKLLAEAIDAIAPVATFTISIPDNLPTLRTNQLLLSQVFANLIDNAIKHHPRSDGSIQISAQERDNCYEFAVSDDGAGIASADRERVFRIFQSVNPQQRADSTGVGLSIVKKIVEAQGGTIWLESALGQGTTFYFTWLKRV